MFQYSFPFVCIASHRATITMPPLQISDVGPLADAVCRPSSGLMWDEMFSCDFTSGPGAGPGHRTFRHLTEAHRSSEF